MNSKRIKTLIVMVVLSILMLISVTAYAYFTINVNGNSNAYNTVITSGQMSLLLQDGEQISLENAIPGSSITKTFKVKNTGTVSTTYDVYLNDLINNFSDKNDLVYTLTSENGCVNSTENIVPSDVGTEAKIISSCSINPNIEHEYVLTVLFKDDDTNQDDNKGKKFSAKVSISDYVAKLSTGKIVNELIKKFVDESYDYTTEVSEITSIERSLNSPTSTSKYVDLADQTSNNSILAWFDEESGTIYYYTDAEKIYLNKDASYTFNSFTGLTSLDLSNFNTSNVTNMDYMFNSSKNIITLNLGDNFDTSNVTTMKNMFVGMKALKELDLKDKFDTSNVTDMSFMFSSLNALTSINLGDKFDTSKVTTMDYMFNGFSSYSGDHIDLGYKFDTSNVTSMNGMFGYFSGYNIVFGDKFDTSKVKHMYNMFRGNWRLETLDLSCFDTSNVENFEYMLSEVSCQTIYVSEKFVITSAMASGNMFKNSTKIVGGAGTTYNENYINREYARIDDPSHGRPGYFTLKTQ